MAGPEGSQDPVGNPVPASIDSPGALSKSYSCVVCHKRKVKCDRQDPCSNCEKASVECIYRPPPPPRRRKRERDLDENASESREKVRRHGAEESHLINSNQRYKLPPSRVQSAQMEQTAGSGRMIMKDGNSVYIDNTLWATVSHELTNATDVINDVSDGGDENVSEDDNDETDMLLSLGNKECVSNLHPNSLHIFKLWQTFLENVNPLIKLLHTPTVQPQILEAMSDLPKAGKELETLMFSIYCISLASMPAGDVEKSFGETKRKLLSRYRRGAQMSFRKVSLLRTSSIRVLQAFMLYLLSMRGSSDPHTIWTLSGVALRISQRIGIHRDGSAFGLSAFETEMRRRIWFQLIIVDSTSAQFCGVATSPFLATADTQPPANANDSDLDPRMTEPAPEKTGATEMIFCLARAEFGKWLRRWGREYGDSNSPWEFLSSSSMTLHQKDEAIDEFESLVENKFLRFCDPSIPLHLATTVMARSAVHFARLAAHHPRQYQDPTFQVSQKEKDTIYVNCLKMAEYAHFAQSNPSIQRFIWHMVNHMPWDAMIFMLSEMRNRSDPEEKSMVWQIIGDLYARYLRQMAKSTHVPLHNALQNLIVKAWRVYIEDCNNHNRAPTPCPEIVSTLLEKADCSTEKQTVDGESRMTELGTHFQELPSQSVPSEYLASGPEDINFLLTDSPNWTEWDNLLNQFQESLLDDTALLSGA
ncbi:hypothetical protein N7481_012020 [Penicillium waksmanii]|uniref:uncharacterized protein n=1 Tax=Penicillium waksmanii TaxID=69791 RepID=UPI002549623B|nr:uncharacterized protein N7481_012020 [Penicillium waksmanii]KAJ5965306.1 hypothetical protein N7481_012020 [Penicillium waksmanii]